MPRLISEIQFHKYKWNKMSKLLSKPVIFSSVHVSVFQYNKSTNNRSEKGIEFWKLYFFMIIEFKSLISL